MPKNVSATDNAIRLHEMVDATLVLINHLPEIDPAHVAPHVRQGFENSLERIHDELHAYKNRAAALIPA